MKKLQLIVLFMLLAINIGACGSPHPAVDELIDHYFEHKDEFNKLVQMLLEENYLRVIFPASGRCQIEEQQLIEAADNERCREYVNLFQELGLQWAYSGGPSFQLGVSTSGLVLSGATMGYYYASSPPISKKYEQYVHIEENWYILLEYY